MGTGGGYPWPITAGGYCCIAGLGGGYCCIAGLAGGYCCIGLLAGGKEAGLYIGAGL